MAFQIGDRVRRVGRESYVPLGSIGKVKKKMEGNRILVHWEWRDDKSSYDTLQQREWLELISSDGAYSVDMCIAAYTAACEQFEAAQLALEKGKQAVADARLNLRDALDGET